MRVEVLLARYGWTGPRRAILYAVMRISTSSSVKINSSKLPMSEVRETWWTFELKMITTFSITVMRYVCCDMFRLWMTSDPAFDINAFDLRRAWRIMY